jgi:hypothetical protein
VSPLDQFVTQRPPTVGHLSETGEHRIMAALVHGVVLSLGVGRKVGP